MFQKLVISILVLRSSIYIYFWILDFGFWILNRAYMHDAAEIKIKAMFEIGIQKTFLFFGSCTHGRCL